MAERLGVVIRRVLASEAEQPAKRQQGLCIFLQGDLGTGKTELCRQLINGLHRQIGGANVIEVTSPSFNLLHSYRLQERGGRKTWTVHHLDLYRLKEAEELHQLGLDDYLMNADLMLVEWGEKCGGLISPDLKIKLEILNPERSGNSKNSAECSQQRVATDSPQITSQRNDLTAISERPRRALLQAYSALGHQLITKLPAK